MRWCVVLDAIAFLPTGAAPAVRAFDRLFGIADFQRHSALRHDLRFDGGLRRVLDQLRTRVLNNSMIQVHRELEEAAQVGGASTWRILLKVIVPLIKPGLIYTWNLDVAFPLTASSRWRCFCLTEKPVLSTYIWGQWHGGGLGDAAAIANSHDRRDGAAGDDLLDLRAQAAARASSAT